MWTADSRPRPGVYLAFSDGRGREISLNVDEPDDRQFDGLLATFRALAAGKQEGFGDV